MNAEHLFIDTNILVYAHDKSAGLKHTKAQSLILSCFDRPCPPAISTQVLQELFVNLVKKRVPLKSTRKIIDMYSEFEVIGHDLGLVKEGMDIHERYKLSLWDSLILAAAQRARATMLWSEDLQAGQDIDGVTVCNPFLEEATRKK